MKKINDLLVDMTKIKSESGDELEMCKFVFNFLKKENFKVRKLPVDKNGFNIIAKIGVPKVYFSIHMDTVKGFLPVKETKTKIYGRGTCDAKGSLAAMICAAIEARSAGLTNFGLIFTVGEEEDFRGIKKLLKSKIKIPFVIVGEPTSLELVNGHYGILVIKLLAKGKRAHSSMPEQGINAIDKLIQAINLVKKIKINKKTFLSVCKISGGIADNIIPDEAEAIISFRVSPDDKTDYLRRIKTKIKDLVIVRKEFKLAGVLTKVPKELSFIKKIRKVKYATELSFFKKGVVLGPGDIKFAHSDKEMIEKSKLREIVDIYKQIISNFNS